MNVNKFSLLDSIELPAIVIADDGGFRYINACAMRTYPVVGTDKFSDLGSIVDLSGRIANQIDYSAGSSFACQFTFEFLSESPSVDVDCHAQIIPSLIDGAQVIFIHQCNFGLKTSDASAAFQHDSLTGLPNRGLFADRLNHAIRLSNRSEDSCIGLVFIDLDNFKPINDTYGHDAGDAVLKEIGHRLRKCLRDSDTVARYGGDEFVALLSNLRSKEDSSIVAERIIDACNRPISINGYDVQISASVGISIWPQDGSSGDELIKAADTAMYRSKSSGRNTFHFFDPVMNIEAQERASIESDLRVALREKQFVLHYQPQFCARTDKIIGAEALIRWNHPVKGMVPPVQFIRVAEETNLISPIGDWVISEAIRQAKEWDEIGMPLRVALNLSARQFVDSLPAQIYGELKRHKLSPALIELELTESFLVDDLSRAGKIIQELRSIGVRIALDDFGTGFSSLQYLRNFPVDTLKIDRSFVGKTVSEFDERMVLAILDIARNFGLDTLAEGVETQEHLDRLHEFGCHSWQGFLRSGAVEPNKLLDFVQKFEPKMRAAA